MREAADDLAQAREGLLGGRLVAADVDDLFEVADALDVVGVDRRGVARIERDEPLGVADRFGVLARLIVGVGGHQDGAAGPLRIGMLALDLAEIVDRGVPVATVQPIGPGGVEQVHRPLHVGEVGLCLLLEGGAPARGQGQGSDDDDERRTRPKL